MSEPEIKLSVEVPENNEENHPELEMDQENEEPKISLDLQQPDDEETERTRYGLNSPKKKKKQSRDLDDEAEADEGEMTPATKLRQTAGINSPKQQKAMGWGNNEENNGNTNALAGVITQVQKDDNQTSAGKGGGVESLVTQVSRDDAQAMAPMSTTQDEEEEDNDTTKTKDSQKDQSPGICACLTSLFTCCSTSNSIEHRTAQEIGQRQKDDQQVTKGQKAPVTSNDKPKEGDDEKEPDIEVSQESSTDYSYSLLPPLSPENKGKRCLVLDLDETLVHSSFKPVNSADFTIPVEIDGVVHRVYVLKRPFVDEFLLECSKSYELVIFTASLSKYADPLLDQLDTHRVIAHRLFRESCTFHGSAYVKDMRRLGRRLKDIIFVDNSPHSYAFQPKNAVPITSWFDDRTDTQLRDFLPVLNTTLLQVKDVRSVLDAHNKPFNWLCRQANVDVSKFES